MYHPSYIYIQPIWTHCMCSAWLIRRSQLHGSSIHVVLFSAAGRLQGSTGWLVFTADKSQIKAARWQHQVTVRGNCTSNCVSELHPASVIDSSALMGEHATHCTVLSADRSTFNQKKKKKDFTDSWLTCSWPSHLFMFSWLWASALWSCSLSSFDWMFQ